MGSVVIGTVLCATALVVFASHRWRRLAADREELLIAHVVAQLDDHFLRPIECQAFRCQVDAAGQRHTVLDADAFRGVIAWVRRAHFLLRALDPGVTDQDIEDRDVRLRLMRAASLYPI